MGKITMDLSALSEADTHLIYGLLLKKKRSRSQDRKVLSIVRSSMELKDKIQAIEDFDGKIVGPILSGLEKFGVYRVLILPDHFTPLSLKTHSPESVPFIAYSSEEKNNQPKMGQSFDEASAKNVGFMVARGHELMEKFIRGFSKELL
jgi:2,3-bisphosphoglycerate-independent phosphoglycerate mutase